MTEYNPAEKVQCTRLSRHNVHCSGMWGYIIAYFIEVFYC